jgi:type IV secretory pathway VirB3-like protein
MKAKMLKGGVERVMLAGVPKVLAVIELMTGMIFVLALHSLYVIPFIVAIHVILVLLYKKDNYFMEILITHLQEDDYLEP